MDKVQEYLELVNPHWLAVVGTGMYIHLRNICIIGLCMDELDRTEYRPTYASVLFIFSAMCLLAEYRLWPRSLKEPPIQMLYVYEMLVAALVTNLATGVLWIPLMQGIECLTETSSKWLSEFNSTLNLDNYSFLAAFADYMRNRDTAMGMAFCLSLLSFVWMLDATESLDGILDMWAKGWVTAKRRTKKRITFECPEVTDWYIYALKRYGSEEPGEILQDIGSSAESASSNDTSSPSCTRCSDN